MTREPSEETRKLPLDEIHRSAGAKMAPFAHWEVPLYYTSILDEHGRVRTRAGLFDISHMGYFTLRGREARPFLDRMLTAAFHHLAPNHAVYSLMTAEQGGIVDDVILYERFSEYYFLIVNASTREKDLAWLMSRKGSQELEIEDLSDEKVLFALQGPASEAVAERFFKVDLSRLRRFMCVPLSFRSREILVARTGYTGEDGFEILAPLEAGRELWSGLLEAGAPEGLAPVGFGARDTLRLEARYLLYGQDMDETTTPLEAGLGWAVDFTKDFPGAALLRAQREKGLSKRLVGFEVEGRPIPRPGYELLVRGKPAGHVTSGCFSPTLKKSIGLGYLTPPETHPKDLAVRIREETIACRLVPGPFYTGESLKKFSQHSA